MSKNRNSSSPAFLFFSKSTRKLFAICYLLFATAVNLFAQQTVVEDVPMADQMRADGKIWVVVVVIAVIFAGIILFLVSMDRKVTKLEKQLKK